jgi:hypothetical protein
VKDAGKDGATTSGGTITSNKDKITCGATDCTTDGDGNGRCCWPGGDQTKAVCATQADGLQCVVDSFEIACDEKADCNAGICCWGDGQTECADDCTTANVGRPDGQPDMQICKTDAECGGTTKCAQKSCKVGAAGDQLTVKIDVCGTPTNCQ